MVVKQPKGALLALNLPQLQNLIKRDPVSYREEFLQQYQHFEASLTIFQIKPEEESKELGELVTFLAQVNHCYPKECQEFPEKLMQLLQTHHTILNPDLRRTMVQALVLLRNRGVVPNTKILPLFFTMFRCRDKVLRDTLYNHIISDIKAANRGSHRNAKLNKTVQNFLYTVVTSADAQSKHGEGAVAAKRSLDVCIELYRKNIWCDTRTVNVIAEACLSPINKIMATAIQFFLNPVKRRGSGGGDSDSDATGSDNEDGKKGKLTQTDIRMMQHHAHINKKTRSNQRKLKRALKQYGKQQKERSAELGENFDEGEEESKVERAKKSNFDFGPLEQVHDPQGFAEKLFSKAHQAQSQTKRGGQAVQRFELRLLILRLVARLIGFHQLQVLNLYPFLQRYLQPHQPEVTSILALLATATHNLVPPDVLQPLVRAIADNFVSDHCAPEVMAAGLNAIRSIAARQPAAIEQYLLADLIQYRKHRDKGVMMAARSLMILFREINPEMLHRRERGKEVTQMMTSGLHNKETGENFGAQEVAEGVDGAELLEIYGYSDESDVDVDNSDTEVVGMEEEGEKTEDDELLEEGSSDEAQYASAIEGQEDEGSDDDDDDSNSEADGDDGSGCDDEDENEEEETKEGTAKSRGQQEQKPSEMARSRIETTRILTQEDFIRIEELKRRRKAELKEQQVSSKKRKKRVAEKDDASASEITDYGSEEEGEKVAIEIKAVLDDEDIIGAYHSRKRAKASYEERMMSIQAGREGREKYGSRKGKRDGENRSMSNKEKRKTKNFKMLVHKREVVSKGKRSLVQRQKALRKHINKQKKRGH
ncbi:Severe Depolymerization of Actin [Spiromyces aspiralis]|uniref:Severe Depolymerization of Actin n=1 Tax=Spiromyces aspiralis TaxID=68401 RepID=A0ACC1HF12_9FUNG|nr:Severe Depolymerization of Actin [Spiromyces aspiralis]